MIRHEPKALDLVPQTYARFPTILRHRSTLCWAVMKLNYEVGNPRPPSSCIGFSSTRKGPGQCFICHPNYRWQPSFTTKQREMLVSGWLNRGHSEPERDNQCPGLKGDLRTKLFWNLEPWESVTSSQ